MKTYTRNTPNERRCPGCKGEGEDHRSGNVCGDCSGRGWIRTAPSDPIDNLASLRRRYRKFPTVFGDWYGQCRQRVVSPVNLPDLRK
jgi:hypothetical protein